MGIEVHCQNKPPIPKLPDLTVPTTSRIGAYCSKSFWCTIRNLYKFQAVIANIPHIKDFLQQKDLKTGLILSGNAASQAIRI